ncbi:hypothetical protein [Archangium sp.]|uniref:cupin domain-containing protein n=1 Tax=Archangium sp. TaxID=1872627 RepID=UPI002D597C1A|nr:hypothetical protein [Archangium sp.]HYO52229.1 hypothetical protein [Archangium sp.]
MEARAANWSTIDDVLRAVLDGQIPRDRFRRFVLAQWNAKRFAFQASEVDGLVRKVAALAETAGITHHGRPDQPVCPSRHFFGDQGSIAARLVFDPPNSPTSPEPIEFHTHPVESVIAVMRGSGSYLVCHRDELGRDVVVEVPLTAGSVVCFPAGVVHTIEVGSEGVETLNITDRLNQPKWRDDPTLVNTGPEASPDFAVAVEPPTGAPTVPYAGFSRSSLAADGIL